jgi:hypothetical protein
MQCHASRKETDDAKQKIIFYALCVLYVLSVACITLDTVYFVVASVSNNAAFLFFQLQCANQLCAQTDSDVSIQLQIGGFAEPILFGCCDFIAQSILVRTTDNAYLFHLFI